MDIDDSYVDLCTSLGLKCNCSQLNLYRSFSSIVP